MYRAFKPRIVQQVAKSRIIQSRFLNTTPTPRITPEEFPSEAYICGTKIPRPVTGLVGFTIGSAVGGYYYSDIDNIEICAPIGGICLEYILNY